ncbi:Protein O-linked-mannose beta-1 [Mactra antiquata]
MPSLHMLGHMVAMAVIATLVKQIMELNFEVNKLKSQLEELKSSPGCVTDDTAEDKSDEQDTTVETNNCDRNNVKGDSKNKSNKIKQISDDGVVDEEQRSTYTSIWCHENTNQVCQFENLCYNSAVEEFVMFSHEYSSFENVNFVDGSITMDLTTVKDHNAVQLTISSLTSEVFPQFKVKWVNSATLVFRPFLPDNLMHMFHDDLFPLHHTLKLMNIGKGRLSRYDRFNVQLFLFTKDDLLDTDTEQFYSLFSKFRLKSMVDYEFTGGLTCFSHIYIGLLKTTTWYDYGFTKPQGPLENIRANSGHIQSTVNFIRDRIPEHSNSFDSQEYLVLFSRRENRKILNEMELTLELVKTTGLKVLKLDYDNYTLLDLIHHVINSRGIIAMHGSLLILSVFLKPGSFVIELFPYAVNPSNYTPYKTLTELNGMNLAYISWSNQIQAHSVGHPDWLADVGGLNHLDKEQREVIMTQTVVPQHLCCKDPSWLYHIYQDTYVDSQEVTSLVQSAISKLSDHSNQQENALPVVAPSKIRNVHCDYIKEVNRDEKNLASWTLNLTWDIPWTMNYVQSNQMSYEILLQPLNEGESSVTSFIASVNNFIMSIQNAGNCYVWVRATFGDTMAGPYSDVCICEIL